MLHCRDSNLGPRNCKFKTLVLSYQVTGEKDAETKYIFTLSFSWWVADVQYLRFEKWFANAKRLRTTALMGY